MNLSHKCNIGCYKSGANAQLQLKPHLHIFMLRDDAISGVPPPNKAEKRRFVLKSSSIYLDIILSFI
ncbi:MAG TPA: hypothetical protein DCZ10_12670 [Pelotomaculum sp.]|nr:hypothetical protein [Pelotomaculum sp.]